MPDSLGARLRAHRESRSISLTTIADQTKISASLLDALVRRVFEEVNFVRSTPLTGTQMARVRDSLVREFQRNSQDNGYVLGQIVRRYEDGEPATVSAIGRMPERIAALTADAIQQAAQTDLDLNRYVKVVLMPEAK